MNRGILLLIFGAIGAYFHYQNKKGGFDMTKELDNKSIETSANIALRRGERINNPANIEKSANKWQGLSADQSADNRFATFVSAEYGIRALVKILHTYYYTYRLNTIQKMLNRYAPPVENNTNAYILAVAKSVGISPSALFVFTPANVFKLAKAIIHHEQGRVIYSDMVIQQGVNLGFK